MNPIKPKKIQTFNDLAGVPAKKHKPMKMAKEKDNGVIEVINPPMLDKNGKPISSKNVGDVNFEYVQKAIDYNETVKYIDIAFSSHSFQMIDGNILVRAYMEVPREIGELAGNKLYAGKPYIAVPKKSGHDMTRIPKNYPFVNKAVIINSGSDKFKMGEEVIIDASLISEIPLPGAETTYLPAQFIHPDINQMDEKKCYGYILCKPYQIYAKLNNQSTKEDV